MTKDYYWYVYDSMGNLLLTVRATTLAKATRLAYSEIAKVGKYGVKHPIGKLKLRKVQGMFENPGIPKDEWIPVHAVKFNSDGGVSLMGEVGGERQANPSKFAKLVGELAEKGARTPKALAAWIGRRKYGKSKFQKMAVKGRKHNPTLNRTWYLKGVKVGKSQRYPDSVTAWNSMKRLPRDTKAFTIAYQSFREGYVDGKQQYIYG